MKKYIQKKTEISHTLEIPGIELQKILAEYFKIHKNSKISISTKNCGSYCGEEGIIFDGYAEPDAGIILSWIETTTEVSAQ